MNEAVRKHLTAQGHINSVRSCSTVKSMSQHLDDLNELELRAVKKRMVILCIMLHNATVHSPFAHGYSIFNDRMARTTIATC